ncbi:RHS repeat-associated core domain-containing protein [Stenotrophobium rhamnosiphilum]|uniref:RHS repeat protein n=1 Tax=Stenotrophobium rhamnosiphilum TaxID=2029166 RepID=A0A2T5MBN4_9GAMM|nr:RHS repeat-associated core domain-containing protein [Stenotrophobium rhamnosiphilum]PTU29150.1 hypothetical protein CJD38_17530 [Stenotrophobium rhamnosiphilum]
MHFDQTNAVQHKAGAIRFSGMGLVALLFVAMLLTLPNAAIADWTAVVPNGQTSPTFGSAVEACKYSHDQFYGGSGSEMSSFNFQHSNTNGRVISASCSFKWINQGQATLPGYANLTCSSGMKASPSGPGGCAPLRQDDSGPPACNVKAGNPINVISGNKSETVSEFTTRGTFLLKLERHYDSQWSAVSRLGAGWRTNFDRRFLYGELFYVRIVLGDGREAIFSAGPASTWVPAYIDTAGNLINTRTDVRWTLVKNSAGWIFTDNDGTVETYNTARQLISIAYRGGYTQTLAYDSKGNNISVTDNFNRQILFTYSNYGLLASVTAPDGKVYQYEYLDQSPKSSGGVAASISVPSETTTLSKVTYPVNNGSTAPYITYQYEDTTNLTALTGITDERGIRFATWTYDAQGHATSSQHAGGVEYTNIQYDFTGNTRTVTNAAGKQTLYTLASKQGVLKRVASIQGQASTNCIAGNTQYGYDSKGFVNQQIDAENRTTTWTNDSAGNPLTKTEASGTALARTTAMTWLSSYRSPTQIVRPGLTIDLTYDSAGRLTQRKETDTTTQSTPYSTNGQTRIWTFGYNVAGLLTTVDGPLAGTSDTTTYGYNASGFLASVTNALNQTTQVTLVNSLGQPLTMIDPNNVTTNFSYDARGHLTQIVVEPGALQAVTSFTYDAAEQVISATEPNGANLSFEYDGAKRLSAIQNNSGERIEYTRNSLGGITNTNIRNSSGSIVKVASKTFDELNRVLSEIGANTQVTMYGYDRTDNVNVRTDAASNNFYSGYDALNRLVSETGPMLYAVSYGYDAQDQVTTVTDPQGHITRYYYNGFGDLIGTVSPDAGTTINTYDNRGLLVTQTKSTGIMSSRTYDVLGRLISITYPNSSDNIYYYYDGTNTSPVPPNSIGRLSGVKDQSGTAAYGYYPGGQQQCELKTAFGISYLSCYAYDLSGNVNDVLYRGSYLTYVRNSMGQVTSVNVKIGGVTKPLASSIQYIPFGRWSQMTLPNGITTTRSFDQDYRITSIGSTGVLSRSYSFDNRDNILSITDGINSQNSQTFSYDTLGHLTSAFGAYGSLAYTYNASGDRLTGGLSMTPSTYTYQSGSHRLATVSGPNAHSYTYDGSGNVIADGALSYSYTSEGRLFAASSTGMPIYFYDGFGRRAAKYVTGPGASVYTRMPDGKLMEETDGAGNVTKEYFYLEDEPLAMYSPAAGVTADIYYYTNDHLATPQVLTNATGAVSWSANYQPFGAASVTTASVSNNLRFPGQYLDAETGFHQNGFRDYEPSLGRYIESDPIGLLGGINTYAYVDGNPLSFTDPEGLAKGGKNNIGTEGLTKQSDRGDVEEALKDAIKNKQAERIKKLRGLLKVIKRGGTMGLLISADDLLKAACNAGDQLSCDTYCSLNPGDCTGRFCPNL